ncbi:peptide chain release factor N(5)-glutamine methyltransferase [Hydrogenophaga sp. 5NK40-0174]|uniref:peptide chain release factor N(5)-glutamine methyltransferase n=1 Tax=Hydrogenophaga sp. 5NK40-0174 TaxID=3127649 RepID=UPI0033424759
MSTVQHLLDKALSHGIGRLESQMLTLLAMGQNPNNRAWLLSHDQDGVPDQALSIFTALLNRRCAGEPMAYLTGRQEFFGLDLLVTPDVLVPRADTETLVEWGLEVLASGLASIDKPAVVDLGTGSGAVALAIAQGKPNATVTATDQSQAALAVARNNAEKLSLRVQFEMGSWWEAVHTSPLFHLALSNPPYISSDDEHLPALRHEPLTALTAGRDGLDDIRAIISGAPAHLAPGGWLLIEHGYDQSGAVRDLMVDAGFQSVTSRMDLAGIERCTGGHLASPS